MSHRFFASMGAAAVVIAVALAGASIRGRPG